MSPWLTNNQPRQAATRLRTFVSDKIMAVWLLFAVMPRSVTGLVPAACHWHCSTSALLLRLPPPLRRTRRTTRLVAQNGWTTGVDAASGATYYYNEQTGVSQWELPHHIATAQHGYDSAPDHDQQHAQHAGAAWRVAGLRGVSGLSFDFEEESLRIVYAMWGLQDELPYTVKPGEEVSSPAPPPFTTSSTAHFLLRSSSRFTPLILTAYSSHPRASSWPCRWC